MKAIVHVALKNGVLDPQGKAVADTLAYGLQGSRGRPDWQSDRTRP